MGAPFGQIGGARREAARVQGEAHHVDRRLQQRGIGALEQGLHRVIRGYEIPQTIDRERRIGLVALEHEIDRLPRDGERRIVELTLLEDGCVARSVQQHIALAQRDVELLGEPQQHLARRRRAAGLEEREMPRRYLGLEREIELAHAPALPPFAQVITDWSCSSQHGGEASVGGRAVQLPCA